MGTSSLGIGGMMPGMTRSSSKLFDIIGEGVQEAFQTACEGGLYNLGYNYKHIVEHILQLCLYYTHKI